MLVYNTQLHKKVELTPVEPGKIRMYVCGPTVYDQIHVGNGRTFLAFDVIRRYLMYKGYQVTFAQNLTDVDDKIIKRANEQGRTSEDVASEFSDAFIEQMHRMGVLDPDIRPRATQEIEAMIEMISGLIEQGHAYAPGNGDVYFSVRSDPSYGTVSGRNIDELKVGARIEANEEKDDDALVFEVGDMLAAVSLAAYPIPGGEAEGNAENNYMWEDAVKVAKKHRAHLMVAVLGKEENLLEKGKLFTKVVAACCRQEYATGIYTSGVVFEPRFYEDFADMMLEDELPIFNWIWFGLWRDENGMNGYTYGLDVFGKDEMEVLGTDAKPSDLRDFLASLVSYVLENDVELHDGETIGFEYDGHAVSLW